MNEVGCAGLAGDFELCVIHVDCDDARAVKCGCRDGTEPYASAAEDCNGVDFGHASSRCGVKSDGQWLNEAEFFEREWRGVELFSGNGDAFSEGSVALYAQCLIGRAGVGAAAQAGGTLSAGGIGSQGYCCSLAQID